MILNLILEILKKDVQILKKLKVKYLFYPNYNDVFSFKTKNKIYLHPFSKKTMW